MCGFGHAGGQSLAPWTALVAGGADIHRRRRALEKHDQRAPYFIAQASQRRPPSAHDTNQGPRCFPGWTGGCCITPGKLMGALRRRKRPKAYQAEPRWPQDEYALRSLGARPRAAPNRWGLSTGRLVSVMVGAGNHQHRTNSPAAPKPEKVPTPQACFRQRRQPLPPAQRRLDFSGTARRPWLLTAAQRLRGKRRRGLRSPGIVGHGRSWPMRPELFTTRALSMPSRKLLDKIGWTTADVESVRGQLKPFAVVAIDRHA